MLRDAAIAWIRSHVPDPRIQADFVRHFDGSSQQGRNCYLAIGPRLTTDGKPRLVHCFCDNLFIFELTPAQARGYQLRPDGALRQADAFELRCAPIDLTAIVAVLLLRTDA